jgi:glucose-6-phosphate isomerase
MGTDVQIDFGNMMEAAVGEHGLSAAMLDEMAPAISRGVEAVQKRRSADDLAFFDLPADRKTLDAVRESWERKRGQFSDVVILGIGGSALGPLALKSALKHAYHDLLDESGRVGAPRLHVLDNVDPVRISQALDILDLETTLFIAITKSGSTAETMSQFLLVHARLTEAVGADGVRDRLVCITDPEKGGLRAITDAQGLETFSIPSGVGGRFSIFTPVGLYAAAVLDIDCDGLLDGAARMDERTRTPDLWANPAAFSAAALYLAATRRGQNIHVLMPYAHALGTLAEWYAQLWAESLGKRLGNDGSIVHTGQTPVKAVGVTDQHSQVQLYVEGPFDKVVTFLSVDTMPVDVEIPAGAFADQDGLGYLAGQTFGTLFEAERVGTELALTEAGRSNYTIRLPAVDAHTLGQLIYLFEVQTAISGELYQINAFDQPGVEAGKINAYAMMGRAGYEKRRQEIDARPPRDEKYIV